MLLVELDQRRDRDDAPAIFPGDRAGFSEHREKHALAQPLHKKSKTGEDDDAPCQRLGEGDDRRIFFDFRYDPPAPTRQVFVQATDCRRTRQALVGLPAHRLSAQHWC
jgi:hypothetical protein